MALENKKAEAVLLAGLRRGDPQAFTQLVDTYGGKIHALSRRYAKTEADAEDITQEIFIAVCKSIGAFRGEAALSTFIYRVALNHCLKHADRMRPDTLPFDDLPLTDDTHNPARHAEQRELAREVETALATLSDGHRDVVILHEMHGLTYSECAALLKVPVGTVKSRLSNAFVRLRERLSGYVHGDTADVDKAGVKMGGEKEPTTIGLLKRTAGGAP